MKLFHLSTSNLNGKVLKPRVPYNWLISNGFEDNKTKRVCFAPDIDSSLRAMSSNIEGKEFYIHMPKNKPKKIKTPTISQVPDSSITGEIWVMEPVELICIGKITILKSDDTDEYEYKYGHKNEHTATLYDWNWKWVKKFDNILEFSIQLLNEVY